MRVVRVRHPLGEPMRSPRPCPVCGEIFEPRKVGGDWTKSCSHECANELRARSMRAGGAKKASAARGPYPTRTAVTCRVCGTVFEVSPSRVGIRRSCSVECARKLRRRTGQRAKERRWYATASPRCVLCGTGSGRFHLHHICYVQHVRRERGDVWDPRNALTLCVDCHSAHHSRKRILPLGLLPDAALEFAAETFGGPAAYVYLRRRYEGDDPRLEDFLVWMEAVA